MTAQARQEVSREELLRRASDLVPRLADRAPEAERLRRVPDETVRDLLDAGLLRIATPDRYGGYGLDYDVPDSRYPPSASSACPCEGLNADELSTSGARAKYSSCAASS